MHETTPTLAQRVRAANSTEGALSALEGAFDGETMVAVTCGPSLGSYDAKELQELLANVPTIAVKQAIDVVGTTADFLCFNSFNVQRFVTQSPSTIRVFQRESARNWPQLNPYDLELPAKPHGSDLKASLAASHDFDQYLLTDTPARPWGPGIMYEIVLYLAVHLGARRLITIGWDVATESGSNRHFYDPQAQSFFDQERSDAYAMRGLRSRLPDSVKLGLRWARAAVSHRRGDIYNRTLMAPGEASLTADSSGAASDWLRSHDVELLIASDTSLVDDRVQRLTRDDLRDALR